MISQSVLSEVSENGSNIVLLRDRDNDSNDYQPQAVA